MSYLTEDKDFPNAIGSYPMKPKNHTTRILDYFGISHCARLVVYKNTEDETRYDLMLIVEKNQVADSLKGLALYDRFGVKNNTFHLYNSYKNYQEGTFQRVLAQHCINLSTLKTSDFKIRELRENQTTYTLKHGTQMVGVMKHPVTKEQLPIDSDQPAYFWPTIIVPAHPRGTYKYTEEVQEFDEYIRGCMDYRRSFNP